MSYLLETLGRGLLGQLLDAFDSQLPGTPEDDVPTLAARRAASPGSLDLTLRLGLAQLRALQLADARSTFEAALRLAPAPRLPAIGLACVCDELGHTRTALHHLRTAAEHDPGDPAIAFAIGFCHERLQETDDAICWYDRANALCPQLRNPLERLAAIAIRRRDWKAALRHYRVLAELDPGDIDALLTVASLLLQIGQPAQAVRQFEQALLIEPACFEGPAAERDEPESAAALAGATAAVRTLVEKYPGVADFHLRLADLYARAGDDARAIEQYEAALAAQPDYLEATIKLGTQHLRHDRYADAARAFNRAVELNDRLMTAFAGLGVAQYAAGRRREAGGSFDLAASLEPNSALLFSETIRLHLKDHEGRKRTPLQRAGRPGQVTADDDLFTTALRRHQQALQQRPGDAGLHYHCGLLLRHAARFEDAVGAFRAAVAINPGYLRALVKLGICQREAGDVNRSIATLRRALTLSDDQIDTHYELGLLFARRNLFDLAVEHLEQRGPGGERSQAAYRENVALALQSIGMVDRAAATWRSLCELTRAAEDARLGRASPATGR